MNGWQTVAEMQLRDILRRRVALGLLAGLPLLWYVSELSAGVTYDVGAGAMGMGWSAAAAALFAVLGARGVDPRLVQAGYRPREILVGRLAALAILTCAIGLIFEAVIMIGSRPADPGRLTLALALGGAVALSLGWAIAALVHRELEATLVLIGIVGIGPTAPDAAAGFLPFYAQLRLTDNEAPPGDMLPLTLHALAYSTALGLIALLLWRCRVKGVR